MNGSGGQQAGPLPTAAAAKTGASVKGLSDPWLEIDGLRWRRDDRVVLDDVSLRVGRGQMVGLLGANGSGKSSILRALVGLVDAQAKSVLLDGAPCALGAAALRSQVGVVHQLGSTDGKLTVAENLRLAGQLYCLQGRQLTDAVRIALAHSGLTERADERLERLSGGLKRRVEVARAQLHAPRALLLDEPTQGLDAGAQRDFWQRLKAAQADRGQAVLVATHDANEAAHCDVLYLLRGGRVVHQGSVAALLAQMAQDVLVLAGPEPQAIVDAVAALGLGHAHMAGEVVQLPCQQGHLLIPKLVEHLGSAKVTAVQLRRASLADVFLALTGTSLQASEEKNSPVPAGKSKRSDKRRHAI